MQFQGFLGRLLKRLLAAALEVNHHPNDEQIQRLGHGSRQHGPVDAQFKSHNEDVARQDVGTCGENLRDQRKSVDVLPVQEPLRRSVESVHEHGVDQSNGDVRSLITRFLAFTNLRRIDT